MLLCMAMICFVQYVTNANDGAKTSTASAKLGVYLHNDSTLFLQRFHLPTDARVDSITLVLHGNHTGRIGTLVILGHEGGAMIPSADAEVLFDEDIIKDQIGFQQVTIQCGYLHKGGQLFVGVMDLKGDTKLVTDRTIRDTMCWDYDVPWNDQLRIRGTSYSILPHAFKIECFSSIKSTSRGSFVPDSLFDPLTSDLVLGSKTNIVFNDVDGDGDVDCLARGVLQVQSGIGWTTLEVSAAPSYHAACNLFGDKGMELVTIEAAEQDATVKVQQIVSEDKSESTTYRVITASTYTIEGFGQPKAHFICDVNGDHHDDVVVIGQKLHVIWGGESSVRVTTDPLPPGAMSVTGAVALPGVKKPSMALLRSSSGTIVELEYRDGQWRSASTTVIDTVERMTGSVDIAALDDLTVIAPLWHTTRVLRDQFQSSNGLRDKYPVTGFNAIAADACLRTEPPVYNEHVTAMSYVDIDADGKDECVVATGSDCHFLRVYAMDAGVYKDVTMDIGLFGLDNVDDFVFCDVNGDLAPDLCVHRRGGFEVYYNYIHQQGTRKSLDFGEDASFANTKVDVYQANRVTSYVARAVHGGGMQVPFQPFISAREPLAFDSTIVTWSDGMKETFGSTEENVLLLRGNGQQDAYSSAKARLFGTSFSQAVLELLEPVDRVVVTLMTMDGRTLFTSSEVAMQSGSISLSEVMPKEVVTAAGLYLVVVMSNGHTVAQQHFVHLP